MMMEEMIIGVICSRGETRPEHRSREAYRASMIEDGDAEHEVDEELESVDPRMLPTVVTLFAETPNAQRVTARGWVVMWSGKGIDHLSPAYIERHIRDRWQDADYERVFERLANALQRDTGVRTTGAELQRRVSVVELAPGVAEWPY